MMLTPTLQAKLDAFDGNLPLSAARTIPNSWYHDSEIAQLERENVFGRSWQYVGRGAQVAAPGSFLTTSIAGEPVLVVRDRDGQLRAFANVCRHRAARIVTEAVGTAKGFQCPYHGWVYDLNGKLKGAPEFDGVDDFDRRDCRLPEYHVSTLGPFVFVHLREPTETVEAAFAPLIARGHIDHFTGLHFAARREFDLTCNWKVFADNYLDGGYHVKSIHPQLAGVIDYSKYHTINEGNAALQVSPLKPSADGTAINSVRKGDAAYYWWAYPNLMMNIYEGTADINVVLPVAPDRCKVIFEYYFSDIEGPAAQTFIAESIRVADKVQDEDVGICEDVQRGLSSSSYATGRYSVRREAGGYHFHQLLARALRTSHSSPTNFSGH